MTGWLGGLLYVTGAPLAGGLLAGADRILTARMQARVGPPLLQPFYDVLKLLRKQRLIVTQFQEYYTACFLLFVVIAGALFFAGGDLLLCVFALTVGGVFLVLGAYAPNSPFSQLGAGREMLQMMAYEPLLVMAALGLYLAGRSFDVSALIAGPAILASRVPVVLAGLLVVLSIKLRKSPFDLAASHHPHQELVRGLTTEFSGPTFALVEIAHWYENVLLLGFISLFFAGAGPAAALVAALAALGLVILGDNIFSRLTWRTALGFSWTMAALGGANVLAVYYGLW